MRRSSAVRSPSSRPGPTRARCAVRSRSWSGAPSGDRPLRRPSSSRRSSPERTRASASRMRWPTSRRRRGSRSGTSTPPPWPRAPADQDRIVTIVAMTSELLEEHYDGARPVRTLVHLFAGQRWRIALAAFAFALKHSPVWIMPLLTAEVIDIVVQHRPLRDLWWSAILMAVFISQNYPLTWVYTRQLSVSVRTVETNLRMALARRLQELSIGYHRRISAGVLQAKIVRDVENVVESTRQTFDSGMAAITTLAGAIVITAVRVPEFLPVFVVAVPVSAVLVAAMRRRMTVRNAAFRVQVERMSARVSEMTHLIPITRAHALEQDELDRMGSSLVGVREAGIRLDVVNGRFGALAWITFQMLSVGCLVGAAWVAWTGAFNVSAGDVVMLSSYFMALTGSVTALLGLAPVITKGLESVRFEHVGFAYDDAPDEHAIEDFSLDVVPGETIALDRRHAGGSARGDRVARRAHGGRRGLRGAAGTGRAAALSRPAHASDDVTSPTPAAASSVRAVTPCSGVTGTVRSVSTRVARPSERASRAVALTQCDSAMPTTSTASMPAARRTVSSVRPRGSVPSKPEYAAAYAPFRTLASGWRSASAGCSSASAVPATPCGGQVST